MYRYLRVHASVVLLIRSTDQQSRILYKSCVVRRGWLQKKHPRTAIAVKRLKRCTPAVHEGFTGARMRYSKHVPSTITSNFPCRCTQLQKPRPAPADHNIMISNRSKVCFLEEGVLILSTSITLPGFRINRIRLSVIIIFCDFYLVKPYKTVCIATTYIFSKLIWSVNDRMKIFQLQSKQTLRKSRGHETTRRVNWRYTEFGTDARRRKKTFCNAALYLYCNNRQPRYRSTETIRTRYHTASRALIELKMTITRASMWLN